jgi:hypothetical protein
MSTASMTVRVRDYTGQTTVEVDVPPDATIGEFIADLRTGALDLPETDPFGQPVVYTARHDAEGRHLSFSEITGEALRPNDLVTLEPDVRAGAARRPCT